MRWSSTTSSAILLVISTKLLAHAVEPALPLDSWPRPRPTPIAALKQSVAGQTGYVVDPMNEKPKPMM